MPMCSLAPRMSCAISWQGSSDPVSPRAQREHHRRLVQTVPHQDGLHHLLGLSLHQQLCGSVQRRYYEHPLRPTSFTGGWWRGCKCIKRGWVTHRCVSKLSHHWFRYWLVTCLAPYGITDLGSTLVQVMAWLQRGAKPLPKPVLTYWQLGTLRIRKFSKIWNKQNTIV